MNHSAMEIGRKDADKGSNSRKKGRDMMNKDELEKEEVMIEQQDDQDESSFCPLFMDGLPANFRANSSLAALASLLDSDCEDEVGKDHLGSEACKKEETKDGKNRFKEPAGGGGKVCRPCRASAARHEPYNKTRKIHGGHQKESSTRKVGEAQLFLSMWKI